MTHVIHKYPLKITDMQDLELPDSAVVLCIQVQKERPCIWARHDVHGDTAKKKVRIHMHATGHPISEVYHYIGTFQLMGGGLVYHAFGEDITK